MENTIEGVIKRLENIVAQSRQTGDPLGIFAVLYLNVTRSVQDGIRLGSFQDGVRMERLDVVFANRYLTAFDAYQNGKPCTQAWKSAFDAARQFDLLVIQYLLMGMNAHINLDLGIAAAESVPSSHLKELEADFMGINRVLLDKINEVQDKLSRVSPLFFMVDWFGKSGDERFAEFSLVKAREQAWNSANLLSNLSEADKLLAINDLDKLVASLNKLIRKPGFWLGAVLRLVKWFEEKDIRKVLTALS
ncbi:MAG: hypothetical protein IT258_08525 [Saprospiraceae bacterium]|nr:hypothetical protein [Saprospiraceae bacterium]